MQEWTEGFRKTTSKLVEVLSNLKDDNGDRVVELENGERDPMSEADARKKEKEGRCPDRGRSGCDLPLHRALDLLFTPLSGKPTPRSSRLHSCWTLR